MTVGSFLHFKGVHADSVSFMPMATSIKEAVKRLCPARPAIDSCWFMPLRLPHRGENNRPGDVLPARLSVPRILAPSISCVRPTFELPCEAVSDKALAVNSISATGGISSSPRELKFSSTWTFRKFRVKNCIMELY